MQYAPVIIPTLNRRDHLSRCLESLAKNTGAEYTSVYVSVDYPPAEKYEKGYWEVREYLDNFDKTLFKEFHVIYQEKNLGPKLNSDFLEKTVRQVSDCYIFSEDDNEFATNFLEYINKGLELYKDNEDVIAICGAKDMDWVHDHPDINFAKLLPAYGFGAWFEKDDRLKEKGVALLLSKETLSFKTMFQLAKRNRAFFDMYICDVLCTSKGLFWQNDEFYWCDSMKSIYMHLTDAVCVVPVKAKSRTWGNDGSGVNMVARDINPEEKWPLDKATTFDYIDVDQVAFQSDNYKLGNEYLKCADTLMKFILSIALYLRLLLSGKDRNRIVKR